jgi:polar amino acid transport system ATP-binding protein
MNPSASVPPILVFDKVDKWYGAYHALQQVCGEIDKGEVVVVCGPSGSGKSTLIRTVNRLEPIQGGRIVLDGQDIHAPHVNVDRLRTGIGFVSQAFNLFPHLSVRDNIILGPTRAGGIGREEAIEIARRLLAKVGLADKLDAMPSQLSGGQQQRVAISRALAMSPPLMLFDEPTSALDPEMVGEVLDVMRQLADDGMTMIVVSHEMGFASEVADRIWFMDQGSVLEKADPGRFFAQPEHPRAQRFLSDLLSPGRTRGARP